MFASTSSRSRKGVLPSHHSSRSKQTGSKRLAALIRLLVILASVAAVFLVGKTIFNRTFVRSDQHHGSISSAESQPCTDDLCSAQHPHTADVAAKAQDNKLSGVRLKRASSAMGLYSLALEDTDGKSYSLDQYSGQVSLVVNVASQCGYTASNYEGIQKLYEKYHDQGFEVLAFPCNQFGGQEPGSLADVQAFAKEKYHITFPIFPKVEVNGENQHPIFTYLKKQLPGSGEPFSLTWNFNKFLVNRQGEPVKHYKSTFSQKELEQDIESELAQSSDSQASSA